MILFSFVEFELHYILWNSNNQKKTPVQAPCIRRGRHEGPGKLSILSQVEGDSSAAQSAYGAHA